MRIHTEISNRPATFIIDKERVIHYERKAEAVSAVLLVIPRTWSLGILMTSAFWGGAIVAHLTGDDYPSAIAPIALLILTWAGSWLRHPELLSSFTGRGIHVP